MKASRVLSALFVGVALFGCNDSLDEDAVVEESEVSSCCSGTGCICRGNAPTTNTLLNRGPYNTASYTSGFRRGSKFGGATIYYPTNGTGTYSGLVMCPGYTALRSSIANWGPFFASHGIVLMTIDTLTTGDQVIVRDDALLDALESLKAENARTGSPLKGKMADRWGLSGWSMGGGGTWLAAQRTPALKSAMTMAGHNSTAGGAAIASGIRVPTLMMAGRLDTCILGGCRQSQLAYDAIPTSTPKVLYEGAALNHFSWGGPSAASGWVGGIALAFQKAFLDGDERYLQFIDGTLAPTGSAASEWRSTVD